MDTLGTHLSERSQPPGPQSSHFNPQPLPSSNNPPLPFTRTLKGGLRVKNEQETMAAAICGKNLNCA